MINDDQFNIASKRLDIPNTIRISITNCNRDVIHLQHRFLLYKTTCIFNRRCPCNSISSREITIRIFENKDKLNRDMLL